ncbi:lysoplasmalogenase [Mycoplasmatota bacterium]|nr:lysoplasmalogenase [Mycoplasmatota bacterium]
MISKWFVLIVFILISFLHLTFEIKNYKQGRQITKPLLMPLLLLYYLFSVSNPNYYIIIALVCGFLGDVFLLWASKQSFLLIGLLAFLTGHIFYILVFLNSTQYLNTVPYHFYIFLIPYLLLGIYILKQLFPVIKLMKIPTTIYMSIIIIMSFTSLTRMFSVPFLSFLLTFIGSLCFLLSDTILAFDLFKQHKKYNDVYVMSTYILAQFLIILGLII